MSGGIKDSNMQYCQWKNIFRLTRCSCMNQSTIVQFFMIFIIQYAKPPKKICKRRET